MKRNHLYEIDHLKNTVVVSKKFLEEASQFGTNSEKLLARFIKEGFSIIPETRKKRTPKARLLSYKQMTDYIVLLDDADDMADQFEQVRFEYRSSRNRSREVNAWFRKTFPRYDLVPEFDDNNHIIHNPNPIENDNITSFRKDA